MAAATVAALAFQPTPSIADPSGKPVSELLRDLQVMYSRTETATDAYNSTAVKLTRQRKRTNEAEQALTSVRSVLAESRREAGRLARQQYRRGDTGLPPVVQLLLTRDPRAAMDGVHLLERAAAHQALTVHRLVAGERRQRKLTETARSSLAKQQRLTKREKQQRDTVRSRLRQVERLLATLSADRLSRMRDLEGTQNTGAQQTGAQQTGARYTLMSAASFHRPKVRRKPSSSGARAVRYALRQIGKPYRYGAAGPKAYDCSGLTSTSWRRAGRSIPRTSQGQWKTLRRVPVNKVRPGDLVIYYKAASHVAMYAGRGKVVHAPRPGSSVKISRMRSVGAVRGAVRPDAGKRPLRVYVLPKRLI